MAAGFVAAGADGALELSFAGAEDEVPDDDVPDADVPDDDESEPLSDPLSRELGCAFRPEDFDSERESLR